MKTIQKSANCHAVIAGEIIDRNSYSMTLEKPWQAVKNNGQTAYFKTKQEAITWILS